MSAAALSASALPASATAWDYRRQARRLRHRFRHNPVGLHVSLRALAAREDAARPPPTRRAGAGVSMVVRRAERSSGGEFGTVAAAVGIPPEAVDRFAGRVAAALGGEGFLRHSARQELLREADRLGIGRFEASLVVATVEHRARGRAGGAGPPTPRDEKSVGGTVLAFLVAEAVLVTLWATCWV